MKAHARAIVARIDPNLHLSTGVGLDSRVELRATDGGTITLGRNVWIACGARLIARGGHIVIRDNALIGEGSIIVASERVTIGADALIAEYVVIRDQDHLVNLQGEKRFDGFATSPLTIGDDVWIGAKASVIRDGNVGSASIVGAHALVRDSIPAFAVAVGVPARIVKTIGPPNLQVHG